MHRKLTAEQIRIVCGEMLLEPGKTTVRSIRNRLRHQYGASGRTERVAKILRAVIESKKPPAPVAESSDAISLHEKLLQAQQRAQRAEDLERRHQDFWAARYQEKVQELENRLAGLQQGGGVSSEQYFRLYQRATELLRRLAQYEEVGPLLPPR